MDGFAVVKCKTFGNTPPAAAASSLAESIRGDIDAYKHDYALLQREGYTLQNYTPKINDVTDVEVAIGDDEVSLFFKPKKLEGDADVVRLLTFLVDSSLSVF